MVPAVGIHFTVVPGVILQNVITVADFDPGFAPPSTEQGVLRCSSTPFHYCTGLVVFVTEAVVVTITGIGQANRFTVDEPIRLQSGR